MQMSLTMRLCIFDALLQNLLGLLNELSMQINRVGRYASAGIVLLEDELRRLSIIILHLAPVRLSLLGVLLGAGAITARVRLLGLEKAISRFRDDAKREGVPFGNTHRASRLPGGPGRGVGRTQPRRRCFGRG